MTGIIAIHRDGIAHVRDMLKIWGQTFNKIIWAVNQSESRGKWWPEGEVFVTDGAGRDGSAALKKAHSVIKLASTIDPYCCLCEWDSTPIPGHPMPQDGHFYGSELWTACPKMGIYGYIARKFMHSPYMATQGTWKEIDAVLEQWKHGNGYWITEHGAGDRWTCLAASTANIHLTPLGISDYRNTITDPAKVREGILAGHTFFHGIKSGEVLQPLLERKIV